MARLAGCVIYDGFKVTSRLRKVFQGTAGLFLFSASKCMYVVGSSERMQDLQADFHVFGVFRTYTEGDLSLSSSFKGFLPLLFGILWPMPVSFQGAYSPILESSQNRRISSLLSIIQEQRIFWVFAPVLHSVPTFWPFHCTFARKLEGKDPLSQI